MTRARSEHGEFKFTVKEFADGTPYLAAEPLQSKMTLLDEAQMFLQLQPGTDIEEAHKMAKYLNQHISTVGITVFEAHPMFGAKPKTR